MRNHGSNEEQAGEAGLTTEDIARPVPAADADRDADRDADTDVGTADGRTAPLYPGEATMDTAADDAADEPGTRENGDEGLTDRTPEGTGGAGAAGGAGGAGTADEPLLGAQDTADYRKAWNEIQGRFVDDPQEAVRSADALVAEVMQTLARTFSDHKQGLEGQWGQGEQVATEDLRLALQHYRSFFNRLLNT
ncbi:hypothetical protein [Streptomyces sp. NRRL F-2580]|uniref:hypothetical protein n=1 Tax=Streptomyces sp. NRRL F-2580 TaxID=1463841 RepID=UPI0004CC5AA4|nr:hypothetical protein [Streptomyces sp. NRRL F-2580]